MTISIYQVRDPDDLVSLDPLAFDIGTGYVTGVTAVLRRCLYAITTQRGRLVWSPEAQGLGVDIRDLQNATLDEKGKGGWRQAIVRQLKGVDFVTDATAGLVLNGNTWIVAAAVTLNDGLGANLGAYPLEVFIGQAAAAINNLGGNS